MQLEHNTGLTALIIISQNKWEQGTSVWLQYTMKSTMIPKGEQVNINEENYWDTLIEKSYAFYQNSQNHSNCKEYSFKMDAKTNINVRLTTCKII